MDKTVSESINPSDFLLNTVPVSSLFGLDRGKPIDRYYVEKFLDKKTKMVSNPNAVLEVGEDTYSRKYVGSQGTQYDILDYSEGMDLTIQDSLPDGKYDVFICTQVFNFIYDVRKAIRGAYHLLRRGGVLLATVAGNICQISRYDMERHGDYWRFTDLSIRLLMEEVFGKDNVSVIPYGNSMAATAFIQGLAVEDIDVSLLDVNDPDYSILIGVEARKL
ncbi:MAG: class I SAM-dependent methyltransferase [Lachnospiraceae bacterium]|nr:class I SAM-dependent methyltransferase [Lachnospiraceae bacterium]